MRGGAHPVVTAVVPTASGNPVRPPAPQLLAVLLFALGLRLWHVQEGLPEFFEEAFPFRRAFQMAGWESGRVDWNPHAFHYPSLTFYLHMMVQWLHYGLGRLLGEYGSAADSYVAHQVDPTSMVTAGRLVGVAADLATVAAVAAIGERLRRGAGLLAALLVALSATLIRDARAIYTDGVMTALAAWSLERMLAYGAGAGRGTLAAGVVLAGLAIGAKYPAALLVLPLTWVVWTRHRRAGLVPWVSSLAGSLAVFVLTSPFLFRNLAATRWDLLRIASQVGEGQLGTHDRSSALFYLGVLGSDLGWPGLALLVAAAVLLARRRLPRGTGAVWLYLISFAVPVLLARLEFERYLVPIEPAVCVLVAIAALELPDLWSGLSARWRERLRAALVLLLVAPAAWTGFRAASVGADTTQAQARGWIEARLTDGDLLVQETHGAPVLDRWQARRVVTSPAFQAADTAWQQRYLLRRVVRTVTIPLLVAGRAVVTSTRPDGSPREIELFESSADLNRVFYEPALYAGADWVLTSDAVRGRYLADTTRFAPQAAFYRLLDHWAERAASLASGAGVTGPELRIYRITERTREAIRSRFGALDPLWWTRDVPLAARAELAQAMGEIRGVPTGPDVPPPWVLALGGVFDRQIQPFAFQVALELAELGRCVEAGQLAGAILSMAPAHVQACGIAVACAEARGDLATAQRTVERLLAVSDPEGRGLPDIRLEYARLLAQTGHFAAARGEIQRALAATDSTGEVARRARALLRRLPTGRR